MGAEMDVDGRAKALEALASGASKAEAARRSNYSRMHIHRLMKDPEFLVQLEAAKVAKAAAQGEVPPEARELDELEGKARKTLLSIMEGEESGEAQELGVRVSAAKAVLDNVHKKRTLLPARRPKGTVPESLHPVIKMPAPVVDPQAEVKAWLEKQG